MVLCLLVLVLLSPPLIPVGQDAEVDQGEEDGQDGVADASGADGLAQRYLVEGLRKEKNKWSNKRERGTSKNAQVKEMYCARKVRDR